MLSINFLNQNFFWILVFCLQIFFLFLLSNSFHKKLHYLGTIISKNQLFVAKAIGFVFFIGTLVHELSHILMARLLFVRTRNINMTTEIIDDKHIRYGAAEIEVTDPFRSSLIGLAPLLFGIILIYFLTIDINFISLSWLDFIKLFFIAQISNSMFLSDSDTKHLKLILISLLIIFIILFIFSFKYNYFNFSYFYLFIRNASVSSSYVNLLKEINLIFLVTLILNLLSNIFLNFFLRFKRY